MRSGRRVAKDRDSVATSRPASPDREPGEVARGWRLLVLIVSLGLIAASCVAPPATPSPTPTGELAQGQAAYAARCAACHDPSANKAPPLLGKVAEPERIEEWVRRGNGKHPTYNSSVFSDGQLRALVEYLRAGAGGP